MIFRKVLLWELCAKYQGTSGTVVSVSVAVKSGMSNTIGTYAKEDASVVEENVLSNIHGKAAYAHAVVRREMRNMNGMGVHVSVAERSENIFGRMGNVHYVTLKKMNISSV